MCLLSFRRARSVYWFVHYDHGNSFMALRSSAVGAIPKVTLEFVQRTKYKSLDPTVTLKKL